VSKNCDKFITPTVRGSICINIKIVFYAESCQDTEISPDAELLMSSLI